MPTGSSGGRFIRSPVDPLSRPQRLIAGILVLLLVDVIWVASSDYAASAVAKEVSDSFAEDQRNSLRYLVSRGTSGKDSQAAIRSDLQEVMND